MKIDIQPRTLPTKRIDQLVRGTVYRDGAGNHVIAAENQQVVSLSSGFIWVEKQYGQPPSFTEVEATLVVGKDV